MVRETEIITKDAITLLKELIAIPSFSAEEAGTAEVLSRFLTDRGVATSRVGNNVWARNRHFDAAKPSLLLNSHHDTVKPNSGYTRDPYLPQVAGDLLYGLGSNDAGGALVSLIATFLYFYERADLTYNLVLGASAEEETSGPGGIETLLHSLPPIDCAIVGEPTLMQLAVAERGLMVLDCTASGTSGHAARNEGENALYKAHDDIAFLRNHPFHKTSLLLGDVKLTATVINTGNKAHNVVPDNCSFVVDVRVNELYTMEEVLDTLQASMQSRVVPRSMRLRSSSIPLSHPLVKAGLALGREYYGSPTTSDKALMPFPALKMGPGFSARSHTADEFIHLSEISEGIALYIQLLNQIL